MSQSSPRASSDSAPAVPQRNGVVKRWIMPAFSLVVLVGLAVGAGFRYLESRQYETTDDAFLEATVVSVSPQVAGRLARVYVTDNQEVKEGDLVAELDARPFEVRLEVQRAAAELARAKQKTAELQVELTDVTSGAGVDQARAGLKAAQETAERARAAVAAAEAEATRTATDLRRFEQLARQDAVALRQRDDATAADRVARARLEEARKQVAAAEAEIRAAAGQLTEADAAPQQVGVKASEVVQRGAEVEQADAAVRAAELDLSYTKVYAPISGRVTRKNADPGEFVQIGQALMALVSSEVWVVANYKETQLRDMRPGQEVGIRVDAYPGLTLVGRIDSFQTGTGARFSLLPPRTPPATT